MPERHIAMDLRQLRHFLKVADHLSFTRAAGDVGIAQPALSRSVSALEAELGVGLFDRHPRGVALTGAGHRFRPYAQDVLDSAERAGGSGRGIEGSVALGLPPSFGASIGPCLLTRLAAAHPRLRLRIVEAYSGHVQAMLIRGEIDLAVVNDAAGLDAAIAAEPLGEDCLYLVQPFRGAAPDILFADLAGQALLLPTPGHGLRILVDRAARVADIEFRSIAEVDSIAIVRELLLAGVGAAILPLSAVRREVEAGSFSASLIRDPEIRRKLVVARRSHRRTTPAVELVRDMLKQAGESLLAPPAAAGASAGA
jgi:DNA-binding transcriptional LysR family regulator